MYFLRHVHGARRLVPAGAVADATPGLDDRSLGRNPMRSRAVRNSSKLSHDNRRSARHRPPLPADPDDGGWPDAHGRHRDRVRRPERRGGGAGPHEPRRRPPLRGRSARLHRARLEDRRFRVALDSRLVHPPKGDHPLGSVLPQLAAWFGAQRARSSRANSSRRRSRSTASARSTHGRGPADIGAKGTQDRRSMPSGCTSTRRSRARRGDGRRLPEELRPAQRLAPEAGRRPTRPAIFSASPIRFTRTTSACSFRRTTGRTSGASSTTISPRTQPGTATSIFCRCSSISTRAGARGAAKREDRRPPGLPLSAARRPRERCRLEHRAGLEPLGRGRASRRRPQRGSKRGRGAPRLRRRGEELGGSFRTVHPAMSRPLVGVTTSRGGGWRSYRAHRIALSRVGAQAVRLVAGSPLPKESLSRPRDRRRRRYRRRDLRRRSPARRAPRSGAGRPRDRTLETGAAARACRCSASAAARR